MKLKSIIMAAIAFFLSSPFVFSSNQERLGTGPMEDVKIAQEIDYYELLGIMKPSSPVSAQDFLVQSLEGEWASLSDFKGRVVFLNFWATWCKPCKDEVKDIDKLYDTLKDEDFTVMAVDIKEDKKKIVAFMEKYDVDFPVYLDPDAKVTNKYGVRAIPTTFIINPEGKIVGKALGPRHWGTADDFMRSLME
jgi:peroxiredoxin